MRTLALTEDQQEITAAANDMLREQWPVDRLREWKVHDDQVRWQSLVEFGVIAMGLSEADGGLGLSSMEEALVLRECGRALVAPRIISTMLGVQLAATCAHPELVKRILGGEPVGLLYGTGQYTIGSSLDGRLLALDAHDCDLLFAWGADGCALVERSVLPLQRSPCIDETLSIETCEARSIPVLTSLASNQMSLLSKADVLLAAYLVGLADAARDMAAAYAQLREAFGHPIGAFQGVKHACADAAVRSEAAWCQTLFASVKLRDLQLGQMVSSSDLAADVAAARWLAGDAAQRNAENNIQVHGGIGFSAEALPHRFVKRAIALRMLGLVGRDLRSELLRTPSSASQ